MGTIVRLKDIKDASWYSKDATWGHDSYVMAWPNESFPHHVSIIVDEFRKDPELKPRIRRWVENNLSDTVIIDIIDKSYRVFYGRDHDWDHSREVESKWMVFSFEDEHSATMFKLAFSDLITEVSDKHPHRKDE